MVSMNRRRATALLAASAAGGWLAPGITAAQEVDMAKVLLGVPPGSMIDNVSRRVAEMIRKGYAANSVVENRTGASGIIAVMGVKTAPPDGKTMLVATSSPIALYPFSFAKLQYNPQTDLIPVTTIVNFDLGLAVGPMVPASVTNMKEFFAWCKANPAKANFASPGPGSTPHFAGAMTARTAGVEVQHVGYRGPVAAVTDLVGGQIAAVFVPLSDLTEMHNAGKIRVIGVTGETRSRFVPNIPTLKEQGFGDYGMRQWLGLFVPAGTPAPVVQKLSAVLKVQLADKANAAPLEALVQEVAWCTQDEFKAKIEAERVKWQAAVKALNFTPAS